MEKIFSGKTIEEALKKGEEEFGISQEDFTYEIVEYPNKGFLGIGSKEAKIKIFCKDGLKTDVESFLEGLFDLMHVKADEIDVEIEEEKYIKVNLKGEELSFLTKRQGEAAEGIQLMTALHMNRKNESYFKATIDINNFRETLIKKLEQQALKASSQVLKTRRKITLPSMSSFQRRIVHAKLQEIENISTYSVGDEPNRRVVVQYQWPDKK